jgi:hypothetical protein
LLPFDLADFMGKEQLLPAGTIELSPPPLKLQRAKKAYRRDTVSSPSSFYKRDY